MKTQSDTPQIVFTRGSHDVKGKLRPAGPFRLLYDPGRITSYMDGKVAINLKYGDNVGIETYYLEPDDPKSLLFATFLLPPSAEQLEMWFSTPEPLR